ncbi:MAG: hypothetical protein MI673_09805 [Thiotrichales bacterium]|nr:hypothetical protein [Thiotrichales bacterium]
MITQRILFLNLSLCLMYPAGLPADQCPTPDQVRDRSITRGYDWSVSEDVTLDMLLEVSELRKVELHNHGEFVACHYRSQQLSVRMDGASFDPNCLVAKLSEEWLPLPGGTLGCTETDPADCHFQIECFDTAHP